MPASPPLYQELCRRIRAVTERRAMPEASVERLALLTTGLVLAGSCVLRRVAAALDAHGLTAASRPESIERRLRRTLNDPHLTVASYEAALRATIDWSSVRRGGRLVLAIDDSSQDDRLHLLRVALSYAGGSLPLAWALWPQNVPQPEGHYWRQLDGVLDRAAALLPAGLPVLVTGDRFFDVPPFIDRVRARGWRWAVRLKAGADLRFRDHQGREHALRDLLRRRLPGPGRRWKASGRLFKKAGWREASVVAVWAPGQAEPLAVLTDLPGRWEVLRLYDRRFWVEPGFRNDKAAGWQWEASQVTDRQHQARLVLAMAWATLLSLCLGRQDAQARLDGLADPRPPGRRPAKPQPPRDSLFQLGLRAARRLLCRAARCALRWRLTDLNAPSWYARWQAAQAYRYIFALPVRP
jgi:hypothetical protein